MSDEGGRQLLRLHGRGHSPWGDDPTDCGIWIYVGVDPRVPFVNGANMTPTLAIPNPVPLRFRLSVGRPNKVEDDSTVSVYTNHQIDIQGDLASSSLSYGDVVFVMPLEYRHDYDVPYQTHDDVGGFVPCRLLAVTGEFIWNAP